MSEQPQMSVFNQTISKRLALRRVGMWLSRVALALIFLLGALLALTPAGRATTRAALLLSSVIGAANATSTQDRPDVRHTSLTLNAANGPVYADLFEPRGNPPPIPGSREAAILISGVGDNRPVPQLVNLEDSFAEAGVVIMSVTTPSLLSYTLTPADEDGVVQAFQALARQPGVNPHAVGIIALSAGSGVACLAAADPRIRDRVAFVTLFGGFFDAADLVQDVGQRYLRFDGRTEAWNPQLVPLQVLANSVAPDLPPADAVALENAFNPTFIPIPSALLATFSPAMQAIYHLLAGDEPDQAAANLARLPANVHALLAALSPRAVLPQIRAKIFLLHDRHDQYVPFTESRHFAAALQAEGHPYEYVEFNIFQHVEVKGDLPISELVGDSAHLFGLLDAVLSYGG